MGKLNQKVALVTSSTKGIGLQIARTLAHDGAFVFLGARRLEASKEIADELNENGYHAKEVYFDATLENTYASMVETVVQEASRIDILVNNFGSTDSKKDLDLLHGDTEVFFQTINRNLKSVYLPIKTALPHMIKQKSGSIINISSIGSVVPDVGRIGYVVSKAAINALTINTAIQYASHNIRCNAVLPGLIATDATRNNMTPEFIEYFLRHVPLHRMGMPEDIADAVRFFASDESSFITGEILEVAGGFAKPTPLYAEQIKG